MGGFSSEWIAYAVRSDTYLAAWVCPEGVDICASRITSAGAVLDSTPLRFPSPRVAPTVASDGDRHYVLAGNQMFTVNPDGTWTAWPLGFNAGVAAFDGRNFLTVVGDNITLFSPTDGTIVASAAMPAGLSPLAGPAFDGLHFVLLARSWTESVVRVSTAGTVIDVTPLEGTPYPFFADISFDGENDVAVWCSACAGDWNPVVVAVLSSGDAVVATERFINGSVLHDLRLASNAMGSSLIAYDGVRTLGSQTFGIATTPYPYVQLITTWAPLSVSKPGAGAGRVMSDPSGIDCGPSCLARFDAPTTVTLTALPGVGYSFIGWGGDCERQSGSCTVTTDAARNVAATFADTTAPTVSVPGALNVVATSTGGAVVDFEASAQDGADGPMTASCTAAGGSLFPPGTTRVSCSATDRAGNVGTSSFDVNVAFAWDGFAPPVNQDGNSVFKLGRTVPLKFQLTGASAGIANLVATLTVRRESAGIYGTDDEAISSSAADTGNQFRYDVSARQYVFNLSTLGYAVGTYTAQVEMGDRIKRNVRFSLRQ